MFFGWNKARMACFVNMLLATRIVNLNKLACVVFSDALQSSRYRRIQRFFSKCPLDYQQIAGFIFTLFFVSGGQWYLSMDRTNWRWGKSDIIILMLGIVFKGTAIPIYWMLLDKRGNKEGLAEGFTKTYNVHHLVYSDIHSDAYEAITRETRIKNWNRQWKINLIEQNNPQWLDLSIGLF